MKYLRDRVINYCVLFNRRANGAKFVADNRCLSGVRTMGKAVAASVGKTDE